MLTDHGKMIWTMFVVLESFLLAGTLFLLAPLSYKCFVVSRCHGAAKTRTIQSKVINTNVSNVLLIAATVYAIQTTVELLLSQAVAHSEPNLTRCHVFSKANRSLRVAGFACLSVFLWFRQSLLYKLPQLKHLRTTCIKCWSYITLLLVVIATVSGIVVANASFSSTAKLYLQNGLCIGEETELSISAMAGVIASTLVQGSLLLLFIRIIGRGKYNEIDIGLDKKTRRLVIRCCSLTAVCVVTDISSLIVVSLIKGRVSDLVTILILDIDQVLNLLAVLLCFSNWKSNLLPWPCCSRPLQNTDSNILPNAPETFDSTMFTIQECRCKNVIADTSHVVDCSAAGNVELSNI